MDRIVSFSLNPLQEVGAGIPTYTYANTQVGQVLIPFRKSGLEFPALEDFGNRFAVLIPFRKSGLEFPISPDGKLDLKS